MRLILLICLALSLWACDSKKSNDQAAVPGPDASCMNGAAFCNSSLYSNYRGFSPYGINPYNYGGYNNYWSSNGNSWNNGYASLCGCSYGSVPTYNSSFGLGCVNATNYWAMSGSFSHWGWGVNASQWTNIPQVSNLQGNPIGNSACYNGAVQSCFVAQPNSCGNGQTCQPISGGSSMGLCGNFGYGSQTGIR